MKERIIKKELMKMYGVDRSTIGKWYKSKTSSFYNYLKQTVPK